jgi:tetratricopeptide (TPR) repeat protein
MARRRVNTQAVIWIASTAVLLPSVAYLVWKNHKPQNPAPYITAGDAFMKKQDYADAVANYSRASELLPEDSTLHLKLGQAFFQQRSVGLDNFTNAVNEFTKAEELKPDSKDAWRGLYEASELMVQHWEDNPNDLRQRDQLPASMRTARDAAHHLLQLDPTSVDAQAAEPILTIRTWLLQLTMPQNGANRDLPPEQIADQAVITLNKLMVDHPENDKIPYWIARDEIYQGQQALKTDRPQDAAAPFALAANQFEASIAKRPDVVGLFLSKASIIKMLISNDPDQRAYQDYNHKYLDALDKAQLLVDPVTNPGQYQLAKSQWAFALRGSNPAKAESVYRDLITRFPGNLIYRVQLAEFLADQPSRRNDAIALMTEVSSLPAPPITNVIERENWDRLASYCKLVRAGIQIDELPSIPDGKARTDLISDIQAGIDSAKTRFANSSKLLATQGRLQLKEGQVRDAVITLTAAADKMMVENSNGNVDFRLLIDEASAYEQSGSISKAIDLLEKASLDPSGAGSSSLHAKLADLNIKNQDYAAAKPDVDWLAERNPTDPSTIVLQIRVLGENPDWAVVKPLYDKLPEAAPGDIYGKYQVASQQHNRDEAIRLLTLLYKSDPGNLKVAIPLIQNLVLAGRNSEAKVVQSDAKKAHPDDPNLNLLGSALNNASDADLIKEQLDMIKATVDPFEREQKYVDYYRLRNNPEEVLNHLKKEAEIQPNNIGVLGTLFVSHLDARRFTDAEAMIPHMTELDADKAHGLLLKCKLSLARQDVPNALTYSREMTHEFPDFGPSWEMYGEALRDAGQWDSACQQFSAAIALQATNIDAWKNWIQCTVQQGKLEDAKGIIAKACQRFPDDPIYQQMRIQFEILYGNPESVLKELTDSVQQHPDNKQAYGMLANAQMASMRAKAQMGQAQPASDYLEQAQDTFKKALTRWPDDPQFATALSQMYVQSEDYTNAENCLIAFSQRPQWTGQPYPLILLANVYRADKKISLAESTLRQALTVDPQSVEAILDMADCQISEQKYDAALGTLMPATKKDLRVCEKYVNLLVGLGRGNQAEVELQDDIKANPKNNGLSNLLLEVYLAEGSYDQGIRSATRDLENDPHDVFAHLWRGKLECAGPTPDLDNAVKDLQIFRDAVPTSSEGRWSLAIALDAKHDRDGAIRELEAALQFDAQNRQARYLLVREYLAATPSRQNDAERLLAQTIAMPAMQHDPQFLDMYAQILAGKGGQNEKAVACMQDAIKYSANKTDLNRDYFNVLLLTKDPKYFQLLLDESNQYTTDPKASWFIFNDRGCAKAGLKDLDGAEADFTTAMDRADAQAGGGAAETIAASVTQKLGLDKALKMVVPRAKNSVAWKVIAINLYMSKGDIATATSMAESALASADSLTPEDRYLLYTQASSLYLNLDPPQPDKAGEICKKMLEIHPNDIAALDNMACILSDMTAEPKWAEALSYSQKAYDLSQKSGHIVPTVYDTHGWVLVNTPGRLNDGIQILTDVPEPDFPEIHYHLAVAYLKKQMASEADQEVEYARDMIQHKLADHQHVDPTLQAKIDAVSKQIDDATGIKPAGKTAS